jgi:hypothetical protein
MAGTLRAGRRAVVIYCQLVGVLYEYFRAADDLAVADLMQAARGQSPVTSQVADGVDAKGVEYTVTLGKLVALILGVAWTPDLVAGNVIWPADVDEDDEGPWVVSLGDPARDALAALDDAQLPQLVPAWSAIEELSQYADSEFLQTVLADLVGLARRAALAGDHLYCWACL